MPNFQRHESGTLRDMKTGSLGKRGERVLPGRVSVKRVDRHGTIILPDGMRQDMPDYECNGVLNWSHNRDLAVPMLPMGRLVPGSVVITKDYVDMDFKEAPHDFAAQVYDLYELQFVNGFSVGGNAMEATYEWSPRDQRAKLDQYCQDALLSGDSWAVFTRFAVAEVSCCGVPSNPGALQRAMAEGLVPEHFLSLLRPENREFPELKQGFDRLFAVQNEVLKRLEGVEQRLSEQPKAPLKLDLSGLISEATDMRAEIRKAFGH